MNIYTWIGRFLACLLVLGGLVTWVSLAFWLYSFTPFGCVVFMVVSLAAAIATSN